MPFSAIKTTGSVTVTAGSDGAIIVNTADANGTFAIDLPAEGIDVSQSFIVNFESEEMQKKAMDLTTHLIVSDAVSGLKWSGIYNSRFGVNFQNDKDRKDKTAHLNQMEWICHAIKGEFTIKSIVIKKVVSFDLKPYEVALDAEMFHDWTSATDPVDKGKAWGEVHFMEFVKAVTVYGHGSVVSNLYANLDGYKKMRISGTPGTTVRLIFNRQNQENSNNGIVNKYLNIGADGSVEFDLNDKDLNGKAHLNAIKLTSLPSGVDQVVIKGIALYKSPSFGETSDANDIQLANGVDVKLARNIIAGDNTVCLPFALSAEQVATTFGTGSKVYAFDGADAKTLNFKEVTAMEAGVPYIVNAPEAKTEIAVNNVNITAQNPGKVEKDGVTFQGIYNVTALTTDGSKLFLATDGKIKKPASAENDANKLKGMRAYFVLGNAANTVNYSISYGGGTTGINAVEGAQTVKAQGVYNLQGVKVAETTDNLAKGIYIVNGKKFVQK